MSYQVTVENLVAQMAEVKQISKSLQEAIRGQLSRVSLSKAVSIVLGYTKAPKPPENAYGYICNAVDAELHRLKKKQEFIESWKAVQEDCMSGEFFAVYFEILREIMLWHKEGLVQYNRSGNTVPMTVEEWMQAGRPKSWSPIVDHMMEKSVPCYIRDKQEPGCLYDFFTKYLAWLRGERKEREAKKADEHREKVLAQARQFKDEAALAAITE